MDKVNGMMLGADDYVTKPFEKSTINLTMMLQQIVTEFLPEFTNRHLETELYLQPNVSLFCDANKMERVFDNLLKNMMNYSYPNTKMKVSMWGEKKSGISVLL